MKKVFLILISLLLTSCNSNSSSVSNNIPNEIPQSSLIDESTTLESSISYIEKDEEILPMDIPTMKVNKSYFYKHETLTVEVENAKNLDWIGLYPIDSEPGLTTSITYKYVTGNQTVSFPISVLRKSGYFSVYLCHNDGYDVFQKQDIYVRDDDDTNYQIKDAKIDYYKENGVNKASINITPSTTKELTYILYWSVDGVRLPNYTPIKKIKVKDSENFTIDLNDGIVMPDIANEIEIEVLEGFTVPFYLSLDDTLKRNKSNFLYSFQVLTDLHIQSVFPSHISHLKMAIRDISSLESKSKGIFTTGDNINRTTAAEYELLLSILNEVSNENTPEINFAFGNHDYMYNTTYEVAVDLFKKYTKMPDVYYSKMIEGNKFIVLASDSKIMEGAMSQTQMDWLENELKETDPSQSTFIFIHQPLKDTVSGSLKTKMNQNWYGFRQQDQQLKAIINKYPNVIMFSGHTHWTLDSVSPALFGNYQNASFVNCASVGYLWNDDDKQETGSEGIYVDVYEDYVFIKGREFLDGKWVSAAQLMFPKKK